MWEYMVIGVHTIKTYEGYLSEEDLNKFGSEGWELVQIVEDDIIFKRKIEEE